MKRYSGAAEMTLFQCGPRTIDLLVIVSDYGQTATEAEQWIAPVGELLVTGLINGNKKTGRSEVLSGRAFHSRDPHSGRRAQFEQKNSSYRSIRPQAGTAIWPGARPVLGGRDKSFS